MSYFPILRVALDCPAADYFDYLPPKSISEADAADAVYQIPKKGDMVLVPFQYRRMVGVVVDVVETTEVPAHKLKRIEKRLTDRPRLSSEWLKLTHFCATYYRFPLGEVIFSVLPPAFKRVHLPRTPVNARTQYYRWTVETPPQVNRRASAEAKLIEALFPADKTATVGFGDDLQGLRFSLSDAKSVHPNAKILLSRFIARGWLTDELAEKKSNPSKSKLGPQLLIDYELTDEQSEAVKTLVACQEESNAFKVFLLQGVTGSGKTEVYVRAIFDILQRGGQVLVLAPEINLTPQTLARLQDRFVNANIVVLHSNMSDGDRVSHWIEGATGKADIVIGTRLSVFTPLPRLKLVIVDEEHDTSYKQQDGMGYHARDLAIWRAKEAGVPVVLGSATPSLESYANAQTGKYSKLLLTRRANPAAVLPTIELVDLREHKPQKGFAAVTIQTIQDTVERGETALVFLNRRGYAPVLRCPSCEWSFECPACELSMVYHATTQSMHCHHCGYMTEAPSACPQCGNQDILPIGIGTQRLEETLRFHFPTAHILRVDRDTASGRHTFDEMRQTIESGGADIVIGTQMLAKGHDFKNVTLVCIVNADGSLHSPDYRAPERLFSTLLQVSGRAGRAEKPGHVMVQTYFPKHDVFSALANRNFDAFAQKLLKARQAAGFPPYAFQALLRCEADTLDDAINFLRQTSDLEICANHPDVFRYDPVPMLLPRKAYRSRAQLLVESYSRKKLQQFLAEWRPAVTRLKTIPQLTWRFDIDPMEF